MSDDREHREHYLARIEALEAALVKCDRYFFACANAWEASDGALVDDEGRRLACADGLDALCDEAAEAVRAVLPPEMHTIQFGRA